MDALRNMEKRLVIAKLVLVLGHVVIFQTITGYAFNHEGSHSTRTHCLNYRCFIANGWGFLWSIQSSESILRKILVVISLLQVVRVPAIGDTKAVDATGAGDLFASGFIYGLVKGLSLEECCKAGACSGGSVIRSLGGEVTQENWQWMYKQM